ncbi:ABC transporter permease subunit/CPBP intramembrane protease [Lacipirellula limnantheis]|uniref:ABC-2 family transporter protein n=1 Tax=Lacipirellula limnantheis TaxID=2528024 RepID=A0A517TZV0_9BACT|nr:ABC transporter permease subunit/CPBP intramembrane protease [Lacipirellula limnantheis]QDT73910.1 ABC-2 family transporter protein [Lacipirellula limnantheis]
MQLKNVKLIYLREMRDQLRDRRTLFLIAVLPLLLYPLLGTSFFQLTQFLQKVEARVLVVGTRQLRSADWLPPLIRDNRFDLQLFDQPDWHDKIELYSPRDFPDLADDLRKGKSLPIAGAAPQASADEAAFDAAAKQLLDAGKVEAVLVFPNGFEDRLRDVRQALVQRKAAGATAFPEPIILYNSADDKSQVTQLRVDQILRRWRNEVTAENLTASNVPVEATTPFELRPRDMAQMQQRQAAVWSKVLPFFVFIWALTGAFYPAVDLCAGEKERGTLETLLTSPALRREIVWGKLLTVMTFSVVTALLNLGSLGMTGKFVIDNLSKSGAFGATEAMTMPPLTSLLWLAVALVPISALFSALCLACAAFARSTKEGQYYLMPIMLVTMPLMMLPMSPGVELNLGNSFIPVTGMVLLLRSVIEGQFALVLKFVWPVLGVTLICCLLAIRWAEEQFNRESVLFRESERLEIGRWLVHLVRDRQATPSFAQAALCVAIILITQFFVSLSAGMTGEFDFAFLAKAILVSQLACVFAPSILMTIMLTREPAKTLLLERTPRWSHLWLMAVLALALHPVVVAGANQITKIYPVPEATEQIAESIGSALDGAPHWLAALALMALLPALCEELAFRGFVLSGFRHVGHKWWAIALSAVAFGLVHTFLHQKISATMMGMIIGYVAVQTESIWPCVLLHTIHNSLQLSIHKLAQTAELNPSSPVGVLFGGESPLLYRTPSVLICAAVAAAILWRLHGVRYSRTVEEQLEEARQRQDSPLLGA